ncbi:hypothetical protein [Thermogemmatispora onikobensis]|uniref:hypothetical protein n=1 Tax=Thermogemmatispora onikobensis TaxID=732234 RepID=UPI000852E492|nr:hypothetical protein [Thermogemmatispora onikobensis]
MLEAVPHHWYSNTYSIRQDGQEIAEIKRGILREQGSIVVEGQTCTIRRAGLTGPFLYEVDGIPQAQAMSHSFRRRFEIDYAGQRYSLRAQSLWTRTFLLERDGKVLGTIRPQSLWNRKAIIEIPGFPLPIVLFFFWLVMIQWQREQAAAASGA